MSGINTVWTNHRRTRPYTREGIKRVKCIRCGHPGSTQWQICADKRTYRVLCINCDLYLNHLVLQWAKCPVDLITSKMRKYVAEVDSV